MVIAMGKRKNGEGTWGKKKINGKIYHFYRDVNLKYYYGKTIEDVKKKIQAEESKTVSGERDIKKMTFYDYLHQWLFEVHAIRIKRNTLDGYEHCINGQIKNFTEYDIGNMQVGTLTAEIFQKYYQALTKQYSRGSIKKVYAIINLCIKYGNKYGHFKEKIDLDEIVIPHEDLIDKKEREIHFLTTQEMKDLYEESKRVNTIGFNFGGKLGEPTYGNNANVIVFIMNTGLRISEAIGLEWDDVDIDNKMIYVRNNNAYIKDRSTGKKIIAKTSPKTPSGVRSIPLNEIALEIIQIELDLHKKFPKAKNVFLTKNGENIKSRQNVARTLNNMISRIDCEARHITPHELRHSFGSALLRQGVDIKIVSQLLGHKDISVTYNTYIHILDEQKLKAVKSLDILL